MTKTAARKILCEIARVRRQGAWEGYVAEATHYGQQPSAQGFERYMRNVYGTAL